jgi:glucokinase
MNHIGAIDIGGTKIAALVAGKEGILSRVTQETAKKGSVRALPEQAIAMLEAACREAGIEAVDAVGVASCGPFVRDADMLALTAPNLCGARSKSLPNDWDRIPLEAVLRERFNNLVIENDGVAALAAERNFGAVRDEANCVYVTWSTGIGFGICVDGRILHGKHGNAGHAGHMLLSASSEALCGCGNRGDVEALASGRNVGERLGMSTADLFGAARQGDEKLKPVAEEIARWFGQALYNLTATLDTRCFVIGGSVWNHHGDWLAPIVRNEIVSRLPALTEGVEILPAALGSLVADIGALSLVMPAEWIGEWRRTEPWKKI